MIIQSPLGWLAGGHEPLGGPGAGERGPGHGLSGHATGGLGAALGQLLAGPLGLMDRCHRGGGEDNSMAIIKEIHFIYVIYVYDI